MEVLTYFSIKSLVHQKLFNASSWFIKSWVSLFSWRIFNSYPIFSFFCNNCVSKVEILVNIIIRFCPGDKYFFLIIIVDMGDAEKLFQCHSYFINLCLQATYKVWKKNQRRVISLPVTSSLAIHTLNITVISWNGELSNGTKRKSWIVPICIIMDLKHEPFKSVVGILCEYCYIFWPKKEHWDISSIKSISGEFEAQNPIENYKIVNTNLSKNTKSNWTGPANPNLSTFRLLLWGNAPWLRWLGAMEEHTFG